MIIVQLLGGIGNQMFQYSLGRTLSLKWQSDLYLDITSLVNHPCNMTPRHYELDKFNSTAYFASTDLLKRVPFSRKDVIRLGIRNLFSGEAVVQYVKEKTPYFHEEVLSLPDNIYLNGYWQSEKYFAEISDIIRKEFSFSNPPSRINQKILEEIVGCNSVSLHIRRGDYISNPKAMKILGVLGIKYYTRALNYIGKKVITPHIFVFSDDIPWVKENLETDLPLHFIDNNGTGKGYEDLRLMSNCQHHIIANSSFSWWGAWLDTNPGKITIAPKKWFNQSNLDTRDLIPDQWIKM